VGISAEDWGCRVERPRTDSYEVKAPALICFQAKLLLNAHDLYSETGLRGGAVLVALLYHGSPWQEVFDLQVCMDRSIYESREGAKRRAVVTGELLKTGAAHDENRSVSLMIWHRRKHELIDRFGVFRYQQRVRRLMNDEYVHQLRSGHPC
jgi:hypothetical protein